jgi:hypothetical protein
VSTQRETIDATWHTLLFISNTPHVQREALDIAALYSRKAREHANVREGIWTVEEAARYGTAEGLKGWVEAHMPNLADHDELGEARYLAASYLQMSFEDTDWDRVARSVLDTLAEEG